MDNKQVNKAPQKSARLVLQAVTAIARSNVNAPYPVPFLSFEKLR